MKNITLHKSISPIVEIHPYIRARMLNPKQVPAQLAEILRIQLVHSVIRRDLENLFLQAILADDYELAAAIEKQCSFRPRHQ